MERRARGGRRTPPCVGAGSAVGGCARGGAEQQSGFRLAARRTAATGPNPGAAAGTRGALPVVAARAAPRTDTTRRHTTGRHTAPGGDSRTAATAATAARRDSGAGRRRPAGPSARTARADTRAGRSAHAGNGLGAGSGGGAVHPGGTTGEQLAVAAGGERRVQASVRAAYRAPARRARAARRAPAHGGRAERAASSARAAAHACGTLCACDDTSADGGASRQALVGAGARWRRDT